VVRRLQSSLPAAWGANMDESKPRRRWFRFSLRTLFVLVAVVSIVLGWVESNRRWIRDRHNALNYAQQSTIWNIWENPADERLPWGLRILGERCYQLTVFDPIEQDEESRIQRFRELFPEGISVRNRRG